MKRFVFRLERLLRLREAQELDKRTLLGQVYRELADVDARKDRLCLAIGESFGGGEAGPGRLLYRKRLERDFLALAEKEEELCARAARLLVELDHVRASLKALKRLKDQRLQKHTRKERRRQDDELGLLARSRHGIMSELP